MSEKKLDKELEAKELDEVAGGANPDQQMESIKRINLGMACDPNYQ